MEFTPDEELFEIEILDGEIVPVDDTAELRLPPERSLVWSSPPVVQTAVAAATGFVAGAATMALLRRYGMLEGVRRRAPESLPLRRGTYVIHIRPLSPPE
jgi:hypothetical protein